MNYDWKKNKAIVDRLYYTERILETTTFAAAALTYIESTHIRKGYFVAAAQRRIPKVSDDPQNLFPCISTGWRGP